MANKAIQAAVEDKPQKDLDAQYIQGYSRIFEGPAIGQAQVAILAEILSRESW